MRRALIIIALVIVLAGAAVGAYFYFSSSPVEVVAPGTGANLPIAGQGTPPDSLEPVVATSTVINPSTGGARLVKISAGPVVPGAIAANKSGSASTSPEVVVSYIERQSGNVYSYAVHAGTLTRTSNRTVPGIQSAVWLPSAATAFVQYLSGTDSSTINSYALPANGSDGFLLSQNLAGIAAASTSILTLASGVNGSIASLARADGTRTTQLFTTPLSAVRVSFAGKNQYLVFTKPSATLSGAAFLVDGAGNFSRIAGPHNGLIAKASPSGKWVLVSYSASGVMQMKLVNAATGASLPLPIATIADKCVWTADDSAIYCGIPVNPSASANYPDDWYQGAVSFADRIWKIQVAGRYAQFVLDFSAENDGSLDAESLAIDPLDTVLVFRNKNDGSLWSYSL